MRHPDKSVQDCIDIAKAYQEAAKAIENLHNTLGDHGYMEHLATDYLYLAKGWHDASKEQGRRTQ